MKTSKDRRMIALWIIVICIGTLLTIFGTYKLSQILSKSDDLKKQHLIPDILLMDLEFEIQFSDFQNQKILEDIYSNMSMQGGDVKKINPLPVSIFFDEKYPTYGNIILNNSLKNLNVNGSAKSKDNDTMLSFETNDNEIKIGRGNRETFIELNQYDTIKKTFTGKINNAQLVTNVITKSQYILDLHTIKFHVLFGAGIEIREIKNVILKTQRTKYFLLKNIKQDDLSTYQADLKSAV